MNCITFSSGKLQLNSFIKALNMLYKENLFLSIDSFKEIKSKKYASVFINTDNFEDDFIKKVSSFRSKKFQHLILFSLKDFSGVDLTGADKSIILGDLYDYQIYNKLKSLKE